MLLNNINNNHFFNIKLNLLQLVIIAKKKY